MSLHHLLHGEWDQVLPQNLKFNLVFTSPPYNIGSESPAIIGDRRNGGYDRKSYRGIREYADSLPEAQYQAGQVRFLDWCASHLEEDGVIVYNHKDRRIKGELVSPEEWINRCTAVKKVDRVVWDRGSTHNHCKAFLYPHTEYLYVLKRADARKNWFHNTDMGGDSRSNVWRIPRAKVNGHNAPFPMDLAMRVISKWCKPGPDSIVCDPYAGSGTTLIAAARMGLQFIGCERLEKYVRLASRLFHLEIGTDLQHRL